MKKEKESAFKKNDVVYVGENKGKIEQPYAYYSDIIFDTGILQRLPNEFISFTPYKINSNHVRPFEPKEGDVLYSCVVYESIHLIGKDNKCVVTLEIRDNTLDYGDEAIYGDSILANEDQKQLLFERLKADGKRWNPETKQLEDLNEPKVGDDVIVWNEPRNQDASITKMTTHSPFIWDMVVRWDGTKEQFDRIRKGGNK